LLSILTANFEILLGPFGELCAHSEGHAEALEQSASSVVIRRSGDDGDIHALELVDLGVVDFSEDQLIA
jgi:hypothetical protein